MGHWLLEMSTSTGKWWLIDGAKYNEAASFVQLDWFPAFMLLDGRPLRLENLDGYAQLFPSEEAANQYLIEAALYGKVVERIQPVFVDG